MTALVALAVPMIGGSLAMGVVFQLVDLAFLSRLGEAPMASVIMVNQTTWQVVMMSVMGLNFATQSMVARAIGSGETRSAAELGAQSLLLALLVSLLIAAAGLFFSRSLFSLSAPDPEFLSMGARYLRILALLSFGLLGSAMFRAILVGAGDSVTPLLATLVQVVVALFFEWVLIFGNLGAPAMGVSGVALGIAAGQWAALAVGLTVLFRGSSRVQLRMRDFRPDPAVLARLVSNAWPPAVQMMGLVVTTFAFLRLAGDFGPAVQAAYSIGLRLGMVVPAFSFPLATACATLVGQALGAGDPRRAWRAVATGVAVHGLVMWAFAAAIFLGRRTIMGWITQDQAVVDAGSDYLVFAAGSFVLLGFNLVIMRALQGAGDFIVPMIISVGSSLLVGIPAAYLLVDSMGPNGIWTGSLLGSAVSTVAMGAWLATGRWTRRSGAGSEASA